MPGRGDNNKSGSAGRGASNQSNQGFDKTAGGQKSNSGTQKGKASVPQDKSRDQSSQRNTSVDKENK